MAPNRVRPKARPKARSRGAHPLPGEACPKAQSRGAHPSGEAWPQPFEHGWAQSDDQHLGWPERPWPCDRSASGPVHSAPDPAELRCHCGTAPIAAPADGHATKAAKEPPFKSAHWSGTSPRVPREPGEESQTCAQPKLTVKRVSLQRRKFRLKIWIGPHVPVTVELKRESSTVKACLTTRTSR